MTDTARTGDTVEVHYTGSLDDGTVFDSSRDGDPLRFEVGSGQVIDGFDAAVRGMEEGERKEVNLEPDEAYGERRDDLVFDVGRDDLPDDFEPELGDRVAVEIAEGEEVTARVVETSSEAVTLDLNHPLAGRTLVFDLELVAVQGS